MIKSQQIESDKMFAVNSSLDINKICSANVMLINQLTRHWLPSKYPPGYSNQFNFLPAESQKYESIAHIEPSVARKTSLVYILRIGQYYGIPIAWRMPILRCKLTFGFRLLVFSFKYVQN